MNVWTVSHQTQLFSILHSWLDESLDKEITDMDREAQ